MYIACAQRRRVLAPCVSSPSFPRVAPSVFRKMFVRRCAQGSFTSADIALARWHDPHGVGACVLAIIHIQLESCPSCLCPRLSPPPLCWPLVVPV